MDRDGEEQRQLRAGQVASVMRRALPRLEACLVEARRRDPSLAEAVIEFVVERDGRVLASRLPARRGAAVERCLARPMRTIRFPAATARTVASFTVRIPD